MENSHSEKLHTLVNWYLCSYLLRFIELQNQYNFDEEQRFISWENTIIVQASSILEAYDKTECIAKEYSQSYKGGEQSIDVQWDFVGITEVLPIYEELKDGAEIAWTERKARKIKNLRRLILPRKHFTELK